MFCGQPCGGGANARLAPVISAIFHGVGSCKNGALEQVLRPAAQRSVLADIVVSPLRPYCGPFRPIHAIFTKSKGAFSMGQFVDLTSSDGFVAPPGRQARRHPRGAVVVLQEILA